MIWYWLWLIAFVLTVARDYETPPPPASLRLTFRPAPFFSPRALPLMALTGMLAWKICQRFWGLALLPGWSLGAWQKWLGLLTALAAAGAALWPSPPTEGFTPPFSLPDAYLPALALVAGCLALVLSHRLERTLGSWPTLLVAAVGGLSAAFMSGRLGDVGLLAAPGPLALPAAALGGLLVTTLRGGPSLLGRDRLTMLEVLFAILAWVLYLPTDLVGAFTAVAGAVVGAMVVQSVMLARSGTSRNDSATT